MNDILKQRLVGALILIALGVVFWPIIFVQPEDKIATGQRSIPTPPEISTTQLDAPDDVGLRASPKLTANVEDMFESETAAEELEESGVENDPASVESQSAALEEDRISDLAGGRTEAPEPLVTDADGVPLAWTLQVATVSSSAKAEELRKRLLKMDQKVYITTLRRNGKTLHRVCVGPKFERAEVENLRASIDAEFGVSSLVARYIP